MKQIYLLPLMLAVLSAPAFGDDDGSEKEFVLEVYPKWYSRKDLTTQGNIGIQKTVKQTDWIEYYLKPSIAYALNRNWAAHAGLGLIYTDQKTFNNTRERRPFVGLSHSTDFGSKWGLSSYFRAEERYRYTSGSDQNSETTRLRLRIRGAYKFNPIIISNVWRKATLSIEGFRSNNNDDETILLDTYDYETHVALGLERSLSKQRKIRFELAWKYKTPPKQISDASVNTIFFKIQYFPSWGGGLGNKLLDRDIDE